MVQLRELLGELVQRKQADTLMEVVFGVLLNAEKVIEDQAIEIQHLRKQLFGRRSEKLSPDQLSLFAQMLASVVAERPAADAPSDPAAPATAPKKKRKKPVRRPLTPTQSGSRGNRRPPSIDACMRATPFGSRPASLGNGGVVDGRPANVMDMLLQRTAIASSAASAVAGRFGSTAGTSGGSLSGRLFRGMAPHCTRPLTPTLSPLRGAREENQPLRGISTVKVEPVSASLRTLIVPPIASTSCREIHRPSPSPA